MSFLPKESVTSFYKDAFLVLSNELSSVLKINFNLTQFSVVKQSFSEFLTVTPDFSYLGVFTYKNRGVLVLLDPKLIYVLSNRSLGGKGIMSKTPHPLFTFSEDFFGQYMVSWFDNYFKTYHLPLVFQRHETHLNRVHSFLSEDDIVSISVSCYLNDQDLGRIIMCHPTSFFEESCF